MNQCVPGWDLDENPAQPRLSTRVHSNSSTSVPAASLDYEVAELTWENGQLAMHGLGLPRVVNNKSTVTPTWDKPSSGGGTLESIVNQATHSHHKSAHDSHELVHWFNHHRAKVNHPTTRGSLTMDALVPCTNNMININENLKHSAHVLDSVTRIGGIGCSTGIGSCNPFGIGDRVTRVEMSGCKTNVSLSESATCGERHSHQLTLDTCELGGAFTSPEDSSGKEYSKTSADDSVCHSRSQRKLGGDDGKNKKLLGIGKSSISTKRSRAAAIHNQSERKRRDRINQRMKTLQKMVPNSNKTDKASMLDEVIEYLKQLQAQIQMMSRMSMPSMMLPLAMQQQLQMSMMGMQMGMGMGMGVMDMNNSSRGADLPPVMPSTAPFMLVPSWDNPGDRTLPATSAPPSGMHDPLSAFLAGQSQPMTMDAYSRLAAMYQQFQHNAGPGSGSKH